VCEHPKGDEPDDEYSHHLLHQPTGQRTTSSTEAVDTWRAFMKLAIEEIKTKLASLNAGSSVPWQLVNGKLHKEFQFADFVAAFGFMAQAALVAERMNHHPEWFNVYRTVRVDLATHDVSGISEGDFVLAEAMDKIASN
jgi:4a-hydroxytetrahydrobiopterin dehydratase